MDAGVIVCVVAADVDAGVATGVAVCGCAGGVACCAVATEEGMNASAAASGRLYRKDDVVRLLIKKNLSCDLVSESTFVSEVLRGLRREALLGHLELPHLAGEHQAFRIEQHQQMFLVLIDAAHVRSNAAFNRRGRPGDLFGFQVADLAHAINN